MDLITDSYISGNVTISIQPTIDLQIKRDDSVIDLASNIKVFKTYEGKK